MNDNPQRSTGVSAPLGFIDPHSGILIAPPELQSLYKMMAVENLRADLDEMRIGSIAGGE